MKRCIRSDHTNDSNSVIHGKNLFLYDILVNCLYEIVYITIELRLMYGNHLGEANECITKSS